MGKGKKRKTLADSPIAKNLFITLHSNDGYDANIKKLENAGISRPIVNSWLNGRRQPKIASLRVVANALGFNLDDWFKTVEPQGTTSNESVLLSVGVGNR